MQMLQDLIKHIADKGREWIAGIKQKGELKLYSFLDKAGVQEKLCSVQQKLNSNIESLEKDIQKLDSIENELRQSGAHFKNAVGMIAGKETAGQKETKDSHSLSKLFRTVQKAYKGMLEKINKAILAYDRLENSVADKNPSVLKKIGQFKNDAKENESSKHEAGKEKHQETER